MLSLIFISLFSYSNDCGLALSSINFDGKAINSQIESLKPIVNYFPTEDVIEYESMLEAVAEHLEHLNATEVGLSNLDPFNSYEDRPFVRDIFVVKELKAAMLKILTPREERILRMRFFLNKSLDATANDLHVSPERIRQIEAKALVQLKRYLYLKARLYREFQLDFYGRFDFMSRLSETGNL